MAHVAKIGETFITATVAIVVNFVCTKVCTKNREGFNEHTVAVHEHTSKE